MRRRALLLALAAAWLAVPAQAQVRDSSEAEAALESLEDAEVGEGEALAERLAELRARPLDLNTAGTDALTELPGVSLLLAERIVRYRTAHDGFRALPELLLVPGFTEALLDGLRPFVTLGAAPARRRLSPYPAIPSWQALRADLHADFVQRYARRLDSLAGPFLGDPARLLTRVRVASRDRIVAALVLDKDPGERFAWRPAQGSYGYDFLSAGLALRRWGRLDVLVVGDYSATFGQGLVLGRTGAMGKGREATRGVGRAGPGLALHNSSEENRFFRGAGAGVQLVPGLSLTAFGSLRTLDASPAPDSLSISALGVDGLHRTASELGRKDLLRERTWGTALRLQRGRMDMGLLYATAAFDPPLAAGVRLYNRFQLQGAGYRAMSAFGRVLLGPALAFGEAARSGNGAVSAVGGAQLGLGQVGEIVVAGRHYAPSFAAPHGEAFGERGGHAVNERGMYVGVRLRPAPTVTVNAYADAYRFPSLRFNTYRPTEGFDVLVAVEHRPRRWLTYYVQGRHERKEESRHALDSRGRDLRTVAPQARASLRLHGAYVFSRRLTLRARVEGVRYTEVDAKPAYGLLLLQDVRLMPVEALTLELRLATFRTDSYDARVYAYEYDVRYSFSVPAFSGDGARAYALVRYDLSRRFRLEARYASTRLEAVRGAAPPPTRDLRLQFIARL